MVPTDIAPSFTFTDFPDPDSARGAGPSLWAGVFYYTGHVSVDLIERRISFHPSGDLADGRGFVSVLGATLQSLHGCPLDPPPPGADGKPASNYYVHFTTLDRNVDRGLPNPVGESAAFGDVLDIFARRCASAGCHLADDPDAVTAAGGDPCLPYPGGTLSLCPRDAYAGLLGITSTEVARMVRVEPGDSSRSYLLRKLLGAPPVTGHVAAPGRDLQVEEMKVIARWIDGGAAK
jgi:hypothetical protein